MGRARVKTRRNNKIDNFQCRQFAFHFHGFALLVHFNFCVFVCLYECPSYRAHASATGHTVNFEYMHCVHSLVSEVQSVHHAMMARSSPAAVTRSWQSVSRSAKLQTFRFENRLRSHALVRFEPSQPFRSCQLAVVGKR